MKVNIEFEDEDMGAYQRFTMCDAMYVVLDEIDGFCRGKIKYHDLSETEEENLQAIRNMIWESGYHNID